MLRVAFFELCLGWLFSSVKGGCLLFELCLGDCVFVLRVTEYCLSCL